MTKGVLTRLAAMFYLIGSLLFFISSTLPEGR